MIFDDKIIIKIFKNYKNIVKGENPHHPKAAIYSLHCIPLNTVSQTRGGGVGQSLLLFTVFL